MRQSGRFECGSCGGVLSLLDTRAGRIKLLAAEFQFDEEYFAVRGTLFVRQAVLVLDLQQRSMANSVVASILQRLIVCLQVEG